MIVGLVADRGAEGATTTVSLADGRRSEDSALANATLAHMLEFDDGHRPSDNHLGCVAVPSALAVAEETGATVGELLDAIIVGYDVMGRVGEATCCPAAGARFTGPARPAYSRPPRWRPGSGTGCRANRARHGDRRDRRRRAARIDQQRA